MQWLWPLQCRQDALESISRPWSISISLAMHHSCYPSDLILRRLPNFTHLKLGKPEIWCQMSWHFGYPKDSMHSASSRKHQAWTEFSVFVGRRRLGKILEMSTFDCCCFHHSLFLSNICRVRWFDQSLQSILSAPKKIGELLIAHAVWKWNSSIVFGVLTYHGPFSDGLSGWLTTRFFGLH